MYDSRIDSTRALGEAVRVAAHPPAVWLQMSTVAIYAHRFDAPNDEATGVIGGREAGVPAYWSFSIKIATDWERAQQDADTPRTRKVAMRTAMVMTPDRGGVFHERDFVRALLWLFARSYIHGAVNLAAPDPLPQREFQRTLRAVLGMPIGLPATKWMAEIGAFVLRTDTELLLKSRRVVPGRLVAAGFSFDYPKWSAAARELTARWRGGDRR